MTANSSIVMPRVFNRVLTEYVLCSVDSAYRAGSRKFEHAILLIILAARSRTFDASRASAHQGVSVNSLAASFRRPFETVRRHINSLIERGLCTRTGSHVQFAVDGNSRSTLFLERIHDHTLRLIEDLRLLGIPMEPSVGVASKDDIIAGGLELLSQTLDVAVEPHRNWTQMHLYYAIMAANARSIIYDKELAYRFSNASTPPSESVRTPVTAAALSRALSIPYQTVRRYLSNMEADGMIFQRSDGWMLTKDWLLEPEILAVGMQSARKLTASLSTFAQKGFPIREQLSYYIHGRPKILDFT